jgi:putative ABC transport system ATP-binding protein
MFEKLYSYSEDLITSGSKYVPVALPLFFSRAITPFYANEPIKNRLIEGVLFAAVGSLNEHLISTDKLKNYALSYLPSVFSLTYNNVNQPLPIKLFTSVSTTVLAGTVLYTETQKYFIVPAITYAIGHSLALPNEIKASLVLAAATEEALISLGIYDKHYLASSASATVVSNAFLNYFAPTYLQAASVIGITAGSLVATNENEIIDYMTPRKILNESYAIFSQYIDPSELDVRISYNFLVLSKLAISIGFYGNHFLTNEQRYTNSLARIEPDNIAQFSKMKGLMLTYIKVAAGYMLSRSFAVFLQEFKTTSDIRFIQEQFLKENLLHKQNFLASTKTNFTATDYLENIDTVVREIDSMTHQLLFSLPKLFIIPAINKEIALGLAGIMAIDTTFSYGMEYIISLKQYYIDAEKLTSSRLDKMSKHDTSGANLVLQNDLLTYARDKWVDLNDQKTLNGLKAKLLGTVEHYCGWIYQTAILYSAYKYLVAQLVLDKAITAEQIFLYVRVLESITDVLFFNTKHQSNFERLDSALNKLEDLADVLHSAPKYDVQFNIDEQSRELKIHDLKFTRGDATRNVTLTVENIVLEQGQIYAVTGSNGCGKSSLLTLLHYILNNILDYSFTGVEGHISFPKGGIKIITQKDFCISQVSLFELLIAPKKAADLTQNENIQLREKISRLIKDLRINSDEQVNGLEAQLDNVEEDWCKLSGGQIKKLAFGKLSLLECPSIVILDETFAPLDPEAKKNVMKQIKSDICLSKALILVVSHDDINGLKAQNLSCSDSFYTKEFQFKNGTATINKLCDHAPTNEYGICEAIHSLVNPWLDYCPVGEQ